MHYICKVRVVVVTVYPVNVAWLQWDGVSCNATVYTVSVAGLQLEGVGVVVTVYTISVAGLQR